ncbi:MAG: FxLYD domain-containing protein [Thermodesulfobacteriota bacterium]
MILRTGFVAAFAFFATVLPLRSQDKLPDVQGIPDAPVAVPGTAVPTDGLGVRLLDHRGEWTSFFSMNGGSEQILLINGQLQNTSGKPLTYVKLQFELLGEDDVVVFRDYGYNRKAEVLREDEYEKGRKSLQDMGVERLDAGARDTFRFIFFKADVPEFRSYRVRVLETQ